MSIIKKLLGINPKPFLGQKVKEYPMVSPGRWGYVNETYYYTDAPSGIERFFEKRRLKRVLRREGFREISDRPGLIERITDDRMIESMIRFSNEKNTGVEFDYNHMINHGGLYICVHQGDSYEDYVKTRDLLSEYGRLRSKNLCPKP